jgi:hypothetical protein
LPPPRSSNNDWSVALSLSFFLLMDFMGGKGRSIMTRVVGYRRSRGTIANLPGSCEDAFFPPIKLPATLPSPLPFPILPQAEQLDFPTNIGISPESGDFAPSPSFSLSIRCSWLTVSVIGHLVHNASGYFHAPKFTSFPKTLLKRHIFITHSFLLFSLSPPPPPLFPTL